MWCHEKKSFEAFDNEDIPEDDIDSLTKFCSEQLKCAMESINPDLKFEMELEQDFSDHKLPTLDCNIWISCPHDQAPAIEFDFYEKPMKSKYVVMEKSAMDYQKKMSILSNDLCRRLMNTKQSIPQETNDSIVDKYSLTLLRLGYNINSVRQIIVAGLRGFKNRVLRAAEAGTKLHRSPESSLDARLKKKIFEKTSWFKGGKKNKATLKRLEKGNQKLALH